MILLIYMFNLLLFLYSLFHIIRSIIFIKNIKINYKTSKKINNNKTIILIPCLDEQNTITETIDYFNKKVIKNKNIDIFIVTTEKEKKKNNIPSTKSIIKSSILCKYKNVYLINYPNKKGYMADQLNYAVNEIKGKYQFNETYICVYNADSRPSPNTFFELENKIIENNFPQVLQQYSYCFSNINNINTILKGFAVYQSNFELKIGLLNAYNNNLLHKHVVGHGLFIRLDLLNKLNGFNTKYWCEDIYLSAYLQNNNVPITPLLSLESIETPNSISNLIKQNAVWFNTSSKAISIFKDVGNLSFRGYLAFINEIRTVVNWLLFPVLSIFIITMSILNNLFLITLINYLIYILIYYLTTICLINKLEKKKYSFDFNVYLGTIIATTISNFGPLYSIFINPKEKHKTKR